MGASRLFNGTSDYADTGEVAAFNHTGGQDYTTGCWYKINSGDLGAPYGNRNDSTDNDGYGLFINDDTATEFAFTKFGVKDYKPTTISPTGDTWEYLIVTIDDASPFPANFYLNIDNTETVTGGSLTTRSTDESLLIGARREAPDTPGLFFPGRLANVVNYDRVLTGDEVAELAYNPESVPGAVGQWALWDNLDRSGNGYNLSFTGTTESFDGPPIHLYPGGM